MVDYKAIKTLEEATELMQWNEAFRNTSLIRKGGSRLVNAPMPLQVRDELKAAVRLGLLGHLKKSHLKPEVFFHPDSKNEAVRRQNEEAAYAISNIAKVLCTDITPMRQAEIDRRLGL